MTEENHERTSSTGGEEKGLALHGLRVQNGFNAQCSGFRKGLHSLKESGVHLRRFRLWRQALEEACISWHPDSGFEKRSLVNLAIQNRTGAVPFQLSLVAQNVPQA